MILERSLSDLQGEVSKVQVAFDGELPDISHRFQILNQTELGKVSTLIVRGEQEELRSLLESYHPLLIDILPLTLEEIFIYELGGKEYEVKAIL